MRMILKLVYLQLRPSNTAHVANVTNISHTRLPLRPSAISPRPILLLGIIYSTPSPSQPTCFPSSYNLIPAIQFRLNRTSNFQRPHSRPDASLPSQNPIVKTSLRRRLQQTDEVLR